MRTHTPTQIKQRFLELCDENARQVLNFCHIEATVQEETYTSGGIFIHIGVLFPDCLKKQVEDLNSYFNEVAKTIDSKAWVSDWSAAKLVIERGDAGRRVDPEARKTALFEDVCASVFLGVHTITKQQLWTFRCIEPDGFMQAFDVSGGFEFCFKHLYANDIQPESSLVDGKEIQYLKCKHTHVGSKSDISYLWVVKCHGGVE